MYNSGLSIGSAFIQDVIFYGQKLSDGCFILLVSFALIPFFMVAMSALLKGADEVDISPIFELFKAAILLSFYSEIMQYLSMAFGVAFETLLNIMPSADMFKAGKDIAEKVDSQNATESLSMWDYFSMESGSFMRSIFVTLSSGAIDIIKIVIEQLRLLMLVMAYFVGPIAILISAIVPGKKDSVRMWFNAYFFIQCLPITLILIDLVFLLYNKHNINGAEGTQGYLFFVATQVVIIAMYLMVAVFTTFFTGMSVASAAMSKVVAISSAVVSMAQKTANTSKNVASGTTKGIVNAPSNVLAMAGSMKDTKQNIMRNHALAKEIFRDPKGTLGFKKSDTGAKGDTNGTANGTANATATNTTNNANNTTPSAGPGANSTNSLKTHEAGV